VNKRFRRDHPVLSGCLVLGVVAAVLWGGFTLLVASIFRPERPDLFHRPGIGVVQLAGVITSAQETIDQLRAFREDERVKAIVLRVESPGGAVGASQEIFAEVQRTDAVKPVVASLGSVAASGGLYAALGARKIIASPGTITGSMGVILKFANLEELFAKIGYRPEVIKSGRFKDIGNPGRAMTNDERQMLSQLIDNVHAQFIADASKSRSLPLAKVKEWADGRIFSGEQALSLGLIDALGNFTDAVNLAAQLAGLATGGDKLPPLIYPEEDGFSLLKLLAGKQADGLLPRGLAMPHLAYQWDPS